VKIKEKDKYKNLKQDHVTLYLLSLKCTCHENLTWHERIYSA